MSVNVFVAGFKSEKPQDTSLVNIWFQCSDWRQLVTWNRLASGRYFLSDFYCWLGWMIIELYI